jgi:16S rRNA G1207 methylase RsmC
MEWEPGAQFDRVLMNPPFEKGGDVKHIQRAFGMLKPGGRLVAICANGPRQALTLRLLAEKSGGLWEELPEGAFADEGTSVKTALIVINA